MAADARTLAEVVRASLDAQSTETLEGIEELTTLWAERGISPSSLEQRSAETLDASYRDLRTSTLHAGPGVGAEPTAVVGERLELGEELGRGGMGVVRLARQPSLRRQVAVKTLLGPATETSLAGLLKEAWVGGALEHPGVVPVHTLAPDEFGVGVVMKRVEGEVWRDRVKTMRSEDAAHDRLETELRVFLQVCQAVAYAHKQGVLHLDLKPENVMLGRFGEVVVLDWGLAAGLPHGPAWLPRAADIARVAGTPEYMAPELAKGAGPRIDARTDVYLLGAILHELVTGDPPHRSPHILGRLYLAFRSEPQDYPGVPDELVAILHRAMHREPEARYADVPALRDAVASYLTHRAARSLATKCAEHVATLRGHIDARAEGSEVRRAFASARFSHRAATDAWPEHPDLPALHDALFVAMTEWALKAGRAELADGYLEELDPATHPRLAERVEALRREARSRAQHERALEAMARDHDLSVGSRFRRAIGVALGLVFIAVNLTMGAAARAGTALGYPEMIWTGAAVLATCGPLALIVRRTVLRNRVNDVVIGVCGVTFLLVQGHWWIAHEVGIAFQSALALTPMYYLLGFGSFAVLVDWRFLGGPLFQVAALLGATAWPAWAYEIIGVGGGLSAISVGLAVRPDASPPVHPDAPRPPTTAEVA